MLADGDVTDVSRVRPDEGVGVGGGGGRHDGGAVEERRGRGGGGGARREARRGGEGRRGAGEAVLQKNNVYPSSGLRFGKTVSFIGPDPRSIIFYRRSDERRVGKECSE